MESVIGSHHLIYNYDKYLIGRIRGFLKYIKRREYSEEVQRFKNGAQVFDLAK